MLRVVLVGTQLVGKSTQLISIFITCPPFFEKASCIHLVNKLSTPQQVNLLEADSRAVTLTQLYKLPVRHFGFGNGQTLRCVKNNNN